MKLESIFKKLTSPFRKQNAPKSIEEALFAFVPKSIVEDCSNDPDIIKSVADMLGRTKASVLVEVASVLDIAVMENVVCPSERLLKSSGYEVNQLRGIGAILQEDSLSPHKFSLVVSDPVVVDVSKFVERGVFVSLALRSSVEQAWIEYEARAQDRKPKELDDKYLQVLKQLARDANERDAVEVDVGCSFESTYEFSGGESKFTGRIHRKVVEEVCDVLCDQSPLDIELEDEQLSSLSISLLGKGFRLRWKEEEKMPVLPVEPEVRSFQAVEEERIIPEVPKADYSTNPQSEKRIILLDDDPKFLLVLSKILESKGWEIEQFSDGLQALQRLAENDCCPKVVISDVHMPHLDGVTFLRKLREHKIPVPVLMLTSDDDHMLEAELAMLGADAFVRKSEDPRILLAWCNNLSKRQQYYDAVA